MKPGLASAAPCRVGDRLKFPDGAAAVISAMDRLADPEVDCVLLAATNDIVGLAAFAGAAAKARGVHIAATSSRDMLFTVGPAHCEVMQTIANPAKEILICSEPFQSQIQPSVLYEGFELDDSSWAKLEAMAAKSYVPATDYSRQAGAGSKSSDND